MMIIFINIGSAFYFIGQKIVSVYRIMQLVSIHLLLIYFQIGVHKLCKKSKEVKSNVNPTGFDSRRKRRYTIARFTEKW